MAAGEVILAWKPREAPGWIKTDLSPDSHVELATHFAVQPAWRGRESILFRKS